jgi:hypothetical protein
MFQNLFLYVSYPLYPQRLQLTSLHLQVNPKSVDDVHPFGDQYPQSEQIYL